MEFETLKTMNDGMYLSLLTMIEVVVLIGAFCAITGFAIYLAGVAWLCFEETRQPARGPMKPTYRVATNKQFAACNLLGTGKPCGESLVSKSEAFPRGSTY